LSTKISMVSERNGGDAITDGCPETYGGLVVVGGSTGGRAIGGFEVVDP
jgi:hypothetical protein